MSEQRVVVITGANRGLGRLMVEEFASHDWKVVATGRSDRPNGLPSEVDYNKFDVADAEACESFWQKVAVEYENAQICLINNAGGYISGSLLELKSEDFAQQMRSNFFTAVYMTQSLVSWIPKARIVNVISSSALAAHAKNAAYGASKAAEMHFFQSLQQEFTPDKYQITNLYPLSIASAGPDPNAIKPEELADFIRIQAENDTTYYLRDVMIYPR